MEKILHLILHDIRSAYNVGAIFRTADGAGVAKIYLSGYSPVPANEGKLHLSAADKMIAKTALGAEKSVPWKKIEDLENLLAELRKENFKIVALEKNEKAVPIKKFEKIFPMVLILGNEVEGVDEEILNGCDSVVSLPMRGQKESLNVSVAAGIAMYELLN